MSCHSGVVTPHTISVFDQLQLGFSYYIVTSQAIPKVIFSKGISGSFGGQAMEILQGNVEIASSALLNTY